MLVSLEAGNMSTKLSCSLLLRDNVFTFFVRTQDPWNQERYTVYIDFCTALVMFPRVSKDWEGIQYI